MSGFDLWRRGLALVDALRVHAGVETEAWAALDADVKERFSRLRTDPRPPHQDRAETIERLQQLANDVEHEARLLAAARERLIARLVAAELLACGFIVAEGEPQRLAVIEPALWAAKPNVDWAASSAVLAGVVYADLRVLPVSPALASDIGPALTRRGPD